MRRLICFLLMLLPLSCIWAVSVDQLNQATVSVSNRSEAVLHQALQDAFSQVLVKTSGNPHVMTLPVIQNALSNVSQWVQSYAYEDQSTQTTNSPTVQLQVIFDQAGIQRLLHDAGQAAWGHDRPLTLVYFDTQMDQYQPIMRETAITRGLPIIFPSMDLSDQTLVWQQNNTSTLSQDQLMQLAKHYGVLSVLAGHVIAQPDQTWQADWTYLFNGQIFQWPVKGDTQQAVIALAMNKVMETIVNQLAVTENTASQSSITLSISGVNDLGDYAKVMHYLRACNDVLHVSVKKFSETGLLLQVDMRGTLAHFQQNLTNDSQLKSVSDTLRQDQHDADLYYYWSGNS